MKYGQRMQKPAAAPGRRKYLAKSRSVRSRHRKTAETPPKAAAVKESARHVAGTMLVKFAVTARASATEAAAHPQRHSLSSGSNFPRAASLAKTYMVIPSPANPRL